MAKINAVNLKFKDIVLTVFLILGIYFLFAIKDVLIGLFISIIIATALNPIISKLEKFKIPRAFGIMIVYITIVSSVFYLASAIIPPLIEQTANLAESLPLDAFTGLIDDFEVSLENLNTITSQLGSVTPVLKILSSTFSSLITFTTFAVITFYFLMERGNLHKYLVDLYGDDNITELRAEKLVNTVEMKIGQWVRGQIGLMVIVGLLTYLGLRLLNIPFALPLAIFAGVLEIIPNIGPTVAALPAIAVPLLYGGNPAMTVFVVALYVLIQQVENNVIVPRIMRSAVGVHPILTILLIVIGLKLAGVGGAILAVPFYLVAKVVYTDVIKLYFAKK